MNSVMEKSQDMFLLIDDPQELTQEEEFKDIALQMERLMNYSSEETCRREVLYAIKRTQEVLWDHIPYVEWGPHLVTGILDIIENPVALRVASAYLLAKMFKGGLTMDELEKQMEESIFSETYWASMLHGDPCGFVMKIMEKIAPFQSWELEEAVAMAEA